MRLPRIVGSLIAILVVCCFDAEHTSKKPSTSAGQRSGKRDGEFFAWEKTPQGQYKQVKKNYFMNEELCKNVINVLNDMSTKEPRSKWILSHQTNSTFECWPASVNPNEYYRKYSVYSDQPTTDSARQSK